jgi:succinate-semialdehyde dehydrogenase
MGVVGAVTPVTNPIVTPMCNAMFALNRQRGRLAPHRKPRSARTLIDAFWRVVTAAPTNCPDGEERPIETTQELMKAVDAVVATGGGGW